MNNDCHRNIGMNRKFRVAVLVIALCLGVNPGIDPVHAQDSSANRALRKAQGMLRQLASEKKALEAKIADLEGQLADVNNNVSQAQDEMRQQQGINAAVRENNAALMERIKSDRVKIQGVIQNYREKQAELTLYQHDRALLMNAVAERDEWIADCKKKNTALIDTGKDLLTRYRDKSVWDSVVESEPVLGLGEVDVQIENQSYRYKLEDLKVIPPVASKPKLKADQTQMPAKPTSSE